MAVRYSVVIKDFEDLVDFAPGETIAVIENATNVGWSDYMNEVNEAFFTMSQEDPKITLLNLAVNLGKHCLIYREGTLVFAGWLGEADENLEDVVFTVHGYLSGFYYYVMDWDREWEGADAKDIIEDAFDWAKAKDKSRVGWLTKNSMQDLWIASGGPDVLALPLYRAPYKRVLTVFREIATYAMSDTTNRVKFSVSPEGVFNLFRNDTSVHGDVRWRLGDGKVRNYQRLRLPVDRRNQILAVGTSPKDATMRRTITRTTNRDAAGLKQEPIYLSWVKNANELERVARARASRAVRVDTDLYLSFFKDTVKPFRADGQDYAIGDELVINLSRGLSAEDATEKIVVGQQVIHSGGSEYVRVLLADKVD